MSSQMMQQISIIITALQKNRTHENQVVLRNVSVKGSAGEYKCQISGEGPLFNTEEESKNLRVAVLPQKPPKVTRFPADFAPGSWLNLNCTSGPSIPPPRLTWLVNGKEVHGVHLDLAAFGSAVAGCQKADKNDRLSRVGTALPGQQNIVINRVVNDVRRKLAALIGDGCTAGGGLEGRTVGCSSSGQKQAVDSECAVPKIRINRGVGDEVSVAGG